MGKLNEQKQGFPNFFSNFYIFVKNVKFKYFYFYVGKKIWGLFSILF